MSRTRGGGGGKDSGGGRRKLGHDTALTRAVGYVQ